jgi:hypothetical protein
MRNLTLLTACIALLWSSAAAAQTPSPAPSTPVRQPPTSPLPSAPTPANQATPNPATNPANAAPSTRTRVVAADNRRDCTQLRGIEKSECERRDTSRDDLPAGVTSGSRKR